MSTILDLGKYGYQEQEFLISGIATAYVPTGPLGDDGRWAVAPNPGVTAPYTVRLLVRRPIDPSRFNGTVVVEWFNETPQFDAAFDWGFLHQELLREGYAYVGVTAQYVSALTLQAWETGPRARYAAVAHPGESFAYDV
jgi:hypothetical protein